MYRNYPQKCPNLWWTQNLSIILLYPKNIIFSEIPKNIEIHNFEPPKRSEPTFIWNYQGTPLGGVILYAKISQTF